MEDIIDAEFSAQDQEIVPKDFGECHRYPPSAQEDGSSVFPVTPEDEWCHEIRRKQKGGEKACSACECWVKLDPDEIEFGIPMEEDGDLEEED